MKQAASKTTQFSRGDKASVLGAIGTDLLDTAWRIAVPVLLLAVAGLLVDRHFKTAPWVTLGATVVGLAIAAWLVKQQLAALERKERS
jgi:hypothetical protein